ncbi:36916_t:CDS:2, partial [Racocetra persica]
TNNSSTPPPTTNPKTEQEQQEHKKDKNQPQQETQTNNSPTENPHSPKTKNQSVPTNPNNNSEPPHQSPTPPNNETSNLFPTPTTIQNHYNQDKDKSTIENNSNSTTPEQKKQSEALLKLIIEAEFLIKDKQFNSETLSKLLKEKEQNTETYQLLKERIEQVINELSKQLNVFENDYQVLVKKINLSLFTLTKTNLSTEEKEKVWSGLLEYTKNIIRRVEEILEKLEGVRFSLNEVVLHEEKDNLIQEYHLLIKKLREEKETILRQKEKKKMIVTPLRKKAVKIGYCYFCDISIATDFPYKLKVEEQNTLGIEIAEGAAFCSQECLLNYCKEYKNREKMRQEEEKRNKEKIARDRQMITEIQGQIASLTARINRLEQRERELELLPEGDQVERPENDGFWRRLGQKLGLVKKPNPLSRLERVRKLKGELSIQLEKTGEKLQKSLIMLSLDEQKEEERKRLEKKILLEKNKLTAKEKEVIDEFPNIQPESIQGAWSAVVLDQFLVIINFVVSIFANGFTKVGSQVGERLHGKIYPAQQEDSYLQILTIKN